MNRILFLGVGSEWERHFIEMNIHGKRIQSHWLNQKVTGGEILKVKEVKSLTNTFANQFHEKFEKVLQRDLIKKKNKIFRFGK